MVNDNPESDNLVDKPKNPKKKKIIAVLLILVILLGGVAYLVFTSDWYYMERNTKPGPYKRVNFVPENREVTNGKLTRTPDGLVVMDLQGTYAEMGYAHGLLMGEYIKYTVELMVRLTRTPAIYANAHAANEYYFQRNETYHESEIHNTLSSST